MSGDGSGASAPHDVELPPKPPHNRRVKCHGQTTIRHESDGDGYRKGDPKLDEDGRRLRRPCIAWAANGTDYCSAHGGSAPQTINAAKRTLSLGALEFAEALREIAGDERIPPETRLKAINSGLDRIGIRSGVDVGLETPAWQGLLGRLFGDGGDAEDDAPPGATEAATPVEPATTVAKRAPRTKAAPPAAPPVKAPRKAVPRKATKATADSRPKFEGW